MFQNPFSFVGRITRTEYALSIIFSPIILIIVVFLSSEYDYGTIGTHFALIFYFWFNFSQNTKRCHDLNQMGFMQFIPFYGIVLIFQEGSLESNKYGVSPKSGEANKLREYKLNQNDIVKLSELVQEALPFILFNMLLVAIIFKYGTSNTFYFNIVIYTSVVICYLLFLILTKNKFYSKNTIETQLIYSTLLYFLARLYMIVFYNQSISFLTFIVELPLIIIVFGLTYISFLIFKFLSKTNEEKF